MGYEYRRALRRARWSRFLADVLCIVWAICFVGFLLSVVFG